MAILARTGFSFGVYVVFLRGAVTKSLPASTCALIGELLDGVWMSMLFLVDEKSSSSSSS
jgi:hypothetical protein